MSAIRRPKIYARERTNLEKVIPLEVPFSIQIDICNACNLKCAFCFHSDSFAMQRANLQLGYMSFELFMKIINDMKGSWSGKKVKKLKLYSVGEPLLNPHVSEMVAYAKKADVAECIEITTNGTLLNEDINLRLIEAGLDILNISINGIDEEQYKNVCSYDMNYENFCKNIKHFYKNRKQCRVFLKYSDIGYNEEQKRKFYSLFEDICDEIFVETISATMWQDTDVETKIFNAHKGLYNQEIAEKKVCPFLFTTMVVNFQGYAHLCCIDWKVQYVLGDLKTENIANIWNGEKLRYYQKMHLQNGKNSIDICQKCESLSTNTIDNIDEYAEQILVKLVDKNIEQ